MEKSKTALFIGHRECVGLDIGRVRGEVERLINCGVENFLNGGQGEFDRICARCVFDLKKDYPLIKNILVIPYLTFKSPQTELFDEIIYPEGLEKYHFKAAIGKRNEYMVENSSHAVCFVKYSYGGAAKTLQFAQKMN